MHCPVFQLNICLNERDVKLAKSLGCFQKTFLGVSETVCSVDINAHNNLYIPEGDKEELIYEIIM